MPKYFELQTSGRLSLLQLSTTVYCNWSHQKLSALHITAWELYRYEVVVVIVSIAPKYRLGLMLFCMEIISNSQKLCFHNDKCIKLTEKNILRHLEVLSSSRLQGDFYIFFTQKITAISNCLCIQTDSVSEWEEKTWERLHGLLPSSAKLGWELFLYWLVVI